MAVGEQSFLPVRRTSLLPAKCLPLQGGCVIAGVSFFVFSLYYKVPRGNCSDSCELEIKYINKIELKMK